MEEKMKEIMERVKNRRQELGLSYQDLSDLTGISKSTFQRYETGGIKNLGIDKLDILAKALKVTPGYLMGWDTDNINADADGKTITSAKEAMEFILKQPSVMAFGGYDIKNMSDDDLISFANDLLMQLEIISHKYKK